MNPVRRVSRSVVRRAMKFGSQYNTKFVKKSGTLGLYKKTALTMLGFLVLSGFGGPGLIIPGIIFTHGMAMRHGWNSERGGFHTKERGRKKQGVAAAAAPRGSNFA